MLSTMFEALLYAAFDALADPSTIALDAFFKDLRLTSSP